MTSTFLGKWTIYVPPFLSSDEGYAGYLADVTGFAVSSDTAGKAQNIAFILRSDGQLCFLLNNNQYVGAKNELFLFLPFVSTLDQATPFVFPGFNPRSLPASFSSKIQVVTGFFMDNLIGALMGGNDYSPADLTYQMRQVTPALETVLASGKGDGLDFACVDLTGTNFQNLSLIGADFSNCNLTNATFTNVNLTGTILTNANLTGATFSDCKLNGTLLTNCNLTNTNFTGLTLSGANFEGGILKGTILSKTNLAGAVFKQSDLTSVIADPRPTFYNTPLQAPSPTNPRTSLVGCRLSQSLIANDWSTLDLTGATIPDLSSPLSSADKPLIAKYAILKGLNNNNLVGLTIQNAVFDYAVLDGLSLNSSDDLTSDLTGASFIQASMHGTNFTGAILKGVNMTGAQLGSLSQLFALPAGYETHLNAGPIVDAALKDQFTQHGITLSTSATLNTLEAGRVWQLNDAGNKIIYTVRSEVAPGNTQVLMVYAPAISASLVNAYMPDAVLTGANLSGVVANGAQFYGSNARLDGFAILEEVELNDANLSHVDFTQANLYGANLSGAQLFNAIFNNAHLVPSANGKATNLSNANLQGADFTDATLFGTNLANAATAINVPTKVIANQGGVYLCSLPYSEDKTTLAQYTAELDAATTGFTLPYKGDPNTLDQYVTALNGNNLSPLKIGFLKHQPPIVLSSSAQIKVIEASGIWQIIDGAQSYTLWTDPDESGATVLYAASSLTNTRAGFKKRNLTLRWQTSAGADTPGQQWLLDNDSENPKNLSTGYVRFIVKLNGNVLDVYGTAVRIERLGDKQQLEMDMEMCNVTVLDVSNMNSQTICPNESTLAVNQQGGKTWDTLWLRASTPPQPPTCVPTDYKWCPPKKTQQK